MTGTLQVIEISFESNEFYSLGMVFVTWESQDVFRRGAIMKM